MSVEDSTKGVGFNWRKYFSGSFIGRSKMAAECGLGFLGIGDLIGQMKCLTFNMNSI